MRTPTGRPGTTRRALALAAGLGVAGAVALTVAGAAGASSTRTVQARSARALLAAAAHARRGDRIVLDPGAVYTLPRTLALDGEQVTLDGRGATLRLADGAERRSDRVIDLGGRSNRVTAVVVAGRPTAEDASKRSWAVQLSGTGNRIDGCTVTAPAGTAIAVAGGAGHRISGNTLTGGGGIVYGWGDALGTRCDANTVLHARGNAISGIGNGSRVTTGHVVSGNTIRWAGRFGIEDWGDIAGTRIIGNRIRDTRLMGISAVGGRPYLAGNRLQDAGTQYGIETSSSGTRLLGNELSWASDAPGRGLATGIIVNGRWARSRTTADRDFSSSANSVTGAGIGLDLYGDLDAVRSDGDRFVDCRERAVNAAPASADSVVLRRADIEFTVPSHDGVDLRDGIAVASIDSVRIEDSAVRFGPRTAGPARDFFVRIDTDRVAIIGCAFDGGGRTDAHRPVVGTASDATAPDAAVRGNRLTGGAAIQPGVFG